MSSQPSKLTFADLRPGMKARVSGYSHHSDFHGRLMDMGLVPGVEFEVVREAPLGDPVQICILGSNLCLRKCEGSCLLVEELSRARGAREGGLEGSGE